MDSSALYINIHCTLYVVTVSLKNCCFIKQFCFIQQHLMYIICFNCFIQNICCFIKQFCFIEQYLIYIICCNSFIQKNLLFCKTFLLYSTTFKALSFVVTVLYQKLFFLKQLWFIQQHLIYIIVLTVL